MRISFSRPGTSPNRRTVLFTLNTRVPRYWPRPAPLPPARKASITCRLPWITTKSTMPREKSPAGSSRITSYNVCYTKLLRIELAMEGMLKPDIKEEVIGSA